MHKNLLLFFVRWPEIGRVKSRLASSLGEKEACRIHQLLSEVCFAQALGASGISTIVCGTGASEADFEAWLPNAAGYWLQPEVSLGERLESLFERAFDSGAQSVTAIGSDAPTLDSASISTAIQLIGKSDVSILPATDGGYVLIGSSRKLPVIFRHISWGTSTVLSETLAVCKTNHLSVSVGAHFPDVDVEADWLSVLNQLPKLQ